MVAKLMSIPMPGKTQPVEVDIERIDREGIMQLIPHRPPILMLDEVRDVVLGKSAIGVKFLRPNDPVFEGHFPSRPVMPGVLIVEAMAQTAAVNVVKTLGDDCAGNLVYFMSIDWVKFRRPVVPGNELYLDVRKKKNKRNVWKFSGVATVNGKVVAEGEFSAMLLNEK